MIVEIPNRTKPLRYPVPQTTLLYTTSWIWVYPSTDTSCTGVTCDITGTELVTATDFQNDDIYIYRFIGTSSADKAASFYTGASSGKEFCNMRSYTASYTNSTTEVESRNVYMLTCPLRLPRLTRGVMYAGDTIRVCYALGPLRSVPYIVKPPNDINGFGYIQKVIGSVTGKASSATPYDLTTASEITSSLSTDILLSEIIVRTYKTIGATGYSVTYVVDVCTGSAGSETSYVRIPGSFRLQNDAGTRDVGISNQWTLPIMRRFSAGQRISVKVADSSAFAWSYDIILLGYAL